MYRYLLIVVYFDSHSLQSEESESDTDLVESGSNAASPSFVQDKETFVFMTLQNDEVEDVWKAHIANVMSESSAVLTVKTSQIFPRLYRVCFLSSFNTWKWGFFLTVHYMKLLWFHNFSLSTNFSFIFFVEQIYEIKCSIKKKI